MSYATTKRKTRQQKIQISARQAHNTPVELFNTPAPVATSTTTVTPEQAAASAYAYVTQDMRKIGWITLLCLSLLAIATLFLSDFPFLEHLRTALHLPTL
jgi:hypothetical protein